MTTATAARVASPITRLADLATALRRESGLFVLGVVVIALHVLDDSFLQPSPGTSAGDHLVGGLVPLAVLALAAWAYPRLRGGRRGAVALVFGAFGIVAGVEAVHYVSKVGASGDDYTGLLAIPAGLLLLGLGAVTLWTTRVSRSLRSACETLESSSCGQPTPGSTSSSVRARRRSGRPSIWSRTRSASRGQFGMQPAP